VTGAVAPEVDALLDAWQSAWTHGEGEVFAPLCAEDVHYEDPLTPDPLEGPQALAGHARRLRIAFPDARIETLGPRLTDGRYVAAPIKLVGTHRGELDELPATGTFVILHAVFYLELLDAPARHDGAGARVWRARAFFDAYGAGIQLGLLPKPGSAGSRALLMLRGFGLRAR
jgi:hypothetical protein